MDGVSVEQAITRDRIRAALGRYENKPSASFENGTVRTVNADGSYEVLLDGDVQPRTCSAYGAAGVGDRVLVCIMANGRCVAVSRMGGEPRAGRNLLLGTARPGGKFGWVAQDGASTETDESMLGVHGVAIDITKSSTGWVYAYYNFGRMGLIKPNTYYTVSFDVHASTDFTFKACFMNHDSSDAASYWSNAVTISAGDWRHVSLTFKTLPSFTDSTQAVYFLGLNHVGTFKFCNFKLEEGSVSTGWTLAPEDDVSLVESGTSSIWRYWKFASGIAIAQGVGTIRDNINTAWGSVFESASHYYSYPFTFVERPACNIAITNSSAGVMLEVSGLNSTTRTPNFYFVRPSSAGTTVVEVEVSIIVIGRWK